MTLPMLAAISFALQSTTVDAFRIEGMSHAHSFEMLRDLTKGIGGRLSGSPQAAKAVQWGQKKMTSLGFENVHLVPCKVPHWVRGKTERAAIIQGSRRTPLAVCVLGGSVSTPRGGLTGEVIEVTSLDEVATLGEKVRGKIVFYNRSFDPTLLNTFAAYGGAVDQRSQGAVVAAKSGAIATVVRSMSSALDDVPHTGSMSYADGVPKIPGFALSTLAANRLDQSLSQDPHLRLSLECNSQTLADVDSASVVGEIRGSEKPDEIIVMGGHLDSWDLGEGAHDDGAGCVQAMEALSLIKRLGLRPKRTIRVVLFMNEENGLRGGRSYADAKKLETHIAAIESDSGGFAPRSFGVTGTPNQVAKIQSWLPDLQTVGIERIHVGGGGADIGPLGPSGTVLIGLIPESQRYFDYHHSKNDTLDKVNPRELQLGAISMAILAWKLSEEGT
ncbi:MAG: M20/M25/M40 family metallo-hydrolase [Armatimonadetes bacterium]|nr:M20/M25/M40 family metallo-hydrolase [Armatimonadota bacterium]